MVLLLKRCSHSAVLLEGLFWLQITLRVVPSWLLQLRIAGEFSPWEKPFATGGGGPGMNAAASTSSYGTILRWSHNFLEVRPHAGGAPVPVR